MPGVASTYATTCGGCPSACGLLVKQRDGRPIKIEGNDASPLTGGGTCAAGQATVLSLYDDGRLRGPCSWTGRAPGAKSTPRRRRAGARPRRPAQGGAAHPGPSPALRRRRLIDELGAALPDFQHVVYDPVSLSRAARGQPALASARPWCRTTASTGRASSSGSRPTSSAPGCRRSSSRGIRARAPRRRRRAAVVPRPVRIGRVGHRQQRRPARRRAPVGARAWSRRRCSRAVARRSAHAALPAPVPSGAGAALPAADTRRAWPTRSGRHRGASLVVSGSDDPAVQMVVTALNALLGNVGRTVDLDRPSLQRQGDDGGAAGADRRHEARRGARAAALGREPGLRPPGGARVPRRAGQGRAVGLVRRPARRDRGARPRALPGPPLPRGLGRRRAGRGALQPAPAAHRAALRHARRRGEPARAGSGRPGRRRAYLRDFWRREVFPGSEQTRASTTSGTAALERGVVELPRLRRRRAARARRFAATGGGRARRAGDATRALAPRATATSSTSTRRVGAARRPRTPTTPGCRSCPTRSPR